MNDERRQSAPLYVDTLDFGAWVLTNLNRTAPATARLVGLAFELVEQTQAAFARPEERADWVDRMDFTVVRLRAIVRLAEHAKELDSGTFLALTERLDGIGRQIGGWKRRLQE